MKELGVELFNKPEDKEDGFHDALRDGVALCQLVNIIRPDSVEDVSIVTLAAILITSSGFCNVLSITLNLMWAELALPLCTQRERGTHNLFIGCNFFQ